MALFRFVEMPDSRPFNSDPQNPSITMRYKAVGEPNEAAVYAYAVGFTSAMVSTYVGTLYRQPIQVDPDGYAQYIVTVPYGPKQKAPGSVSWTFDTTGATINIKASKEHIESFDASGATGNDHHKGAIGVKGDGDVEGADIVIPALKMSYTFNHPYGVITETHARALAGVTGMTNLNAWRDFEEEELLFLGATGADGTETDAQISYHMVAQQNAASLSISDITGIVKAGHHLVWLEFKAEVDSGKAVRQPLYAHVERVYDSVDFATALGFS